MHLLLALLQVVGPSHVLAAPRPPNVLVLVADDVGVDLVGAYAQDHPDLALAPCTPNLDQLAATGMRFTNAWSNPVCSATRAMLLSGKRASRTGVGAITIEVLSQKNHGLQPSEPSLAKLLAGHASAALGKWHVSDPSLDGPAYTHALDLGFDSYQGLLYGQVPAYDDWPKVISPPGLVLDHYDYYATTDTTQDALAALGTLEEPWLLYVAYAAAHTPNHCPTEHGLDPSECQAGPCALNWCQDCPTLVNDPLCSALGADACQVRAMMHALDSKIGRILALVDPADTVVVFTADNGTLAEAVVPPFDPKHAKGTLYQGGVNVPLIVRAPGAAPGVCHELVSLSDLMATLADLTGEPLPADPDIDSVSLTQHLFPGGPGGGAQPRSHVYAERFDSNFVPAVGGGPPPGYQARFHWRAVRDARFKLIEFHGWNEKLGTCVDSLQFFELAAFPGQDPSQGPDPFEQDDLMPSQGSWSAEQQAAFADLTLQLSVTYARLETICD